MMKYVLSTKYLVAIKKKENKSTFCPHYCFKKDKNITRIFSPHQANTPVISPGRSHEER